MGIFVRILSSRRKGMIKAVLFDLDGTISNSKEGITKSVQYALKSFGIEEPDLEKLTAFIGPPLVALFYLKVILTIFFL